MATTSVQSDRVRPRQAGLAILWHAIFRLLYYLLMISLAVLFLFPFYTMVIGSFMPLSELFSFTPNLWPKSPTLDNYAQLMNQFPYLRYLFNSFALATGQTLGVLFFCSLAGFTFAKRQFPGREALVLAMLAG